jgi:hypothetical protein
MKLLILKSLENLWHVVDEVEHTADMSGEDHIIKQLKGIAFRYDKAFSDLFDALDVVDEDDIQVGFTNQEELPDEET